MENSYKSKCTAAVIAALCLFMKPALAQEQDYHTQYNQDYKTAVGIRAGLPFGVTFKAKTGKTTAFEGIMGTYGGGNFNLTGLLEFSRGTKVKGLRVYAGPGAHFNYFNDLRYYRYYYFNSKEHVIYASYPERYFSMGVDGIFGVEYTFKDAPVNVSFDMKPTFDMGRYDAVFFMDAAISIRFVF